MLGKFKQRSERQERIDTGDYTADEYRRFLREIAFINRHLGDRRALRRSVFQEIEERGLTEFSLLDVGAGSGELLRATAEWARSTGRRARLAGIDLSPISPAAAASADGIAHVQGDARQLPLTDGSFDIVISSLFFHHLSDDDASRVLAEMRRVARETVYVIDLVRHPAAWILYRMMCSALSISRLVREDGSLSVMRGFTDGELSKIARNAGAVDAVERRSAPYRIILKTSGGAAGQA